MLIIVHITATDSYGVYFDTDIIWAERFLDINITKCKTF
ncbi:unnamed protein product, partial [marine sediment metagenome]